MVTPSFSSAQTGNTLPNMKINLGREEIDWEKYHKDNPTSAPMLASPESDDSDKPKRMVYPTLYIHDAPSDLGSLPDTGTAVVKYRIIEKSISDRNGEKTARCELEIQSLTPKGKTAAVTEGDGQVDAESALDEYFEGEKD